MTDYKTLSDSELTEALNFHRRQRNMSRGLNEAAHMRQTQIVRLLEAEEARRLEEAVQVDKKNYSWGKMITVHHGSSRSFPLHPEHQEKIKNLKDGESTSFTDETRRKVKAHREGDTVHLQHADSNTKTPVAHSHFTEEVEIDEQIKGWKHAASDISKMRGAQGKNVKLVSLKKDGTESKMNDATKVFRSEDEAQEHHDRVTKLNPKSKIRHNLYVDGKHIKTLGEEVEQIDEVSASTLRSYIDKSRSDKKAAMKDRTAAEKNVKQYGMASDKKERDDAARRVGNRNQGISVANKKLGTYPADKAKAKVMAREEVEQIDEISTDLKKRYVEKGAEDVVDRFTGRGKYEKPRNPANFTKSGRPKKSVLNSPASVKYRAKLDNRREIVNKVSQEVHGKKRFGEEVEINEASYRDIGYRNMMKADQKAEKELAKLRAQQAKAQAKKDAKALSSKPSKPEEFKEESNLRITKVYNKWPKPATYAVHNADRSYHKEFDSMEAAQAHKAEKSK